MQKRTVEEPRHGLESDVGMWRNVETILESERRWPHVIEETPRTYRASTASRKSPTHAQFTDVCRS
jgi:hypothetical protein